MELESQNKTESEENNKIGPAKFLQAISGKNINFLIGAGASVPLCPTLRLPGKLNFSFEDVVSHPDISELALKALYLYYYKTVISECVLDRLREKDKNKKNKEVFKSYKTFIERLSRLLYNAGNEVPKRVNIFTTNYDLMFEYTVDKYLKDNPLLYFNDGSRGNFERFINSENYNLNVTHSGFNDNYRREIPAINLYKMHGSVSWKYYEDKDGTDKEKIVIDAIFGKIQKINKIYDELNKKTIFEDIGWWQSEHDSSVAVGVEDALYYISEDIDDAKISVSDYITKLERELAELEVDEKLLDVFFKAYQDLPIINPNKSKFSTTVLNNHYYQLLRAFSYELEKKQTVLIVFGFSFADEHILSIFKRSLLNPQLQVYIIGYSRNGRNDLRDKFRGYRNITFLPEDPEEKQSQQESDKEVKGDFKYLNHLLGAEL